MFVLAIACFRQERSNVWAIRGPTCVLSDETKFSIGLDLFILMHALMASVYLHT
jgi:hypothetical protein